MKIAFLCDYYYPYEVSGAEVSSRLLAQALSAKGHKIVVITPDFTGLPKEKFNNVQIRRFPFFHRKKIQVLPIWLVDSPIWFLYTAYWIWKLANEEKIDVLAVQNKNLVIPATLANLLLKKPLTITVRDYRLLCDLGLCLHNDRGQICDLVKYFMWEIPHFINLYKKPNVQNYMYGYVVGLYEYTLRVVNRFCLNQSRKVVCISESQRKIYELAGIRNTIKIFNPLVLEESLEFPREKNLLFVGRYSIGKGRKILDGVIPKFLNRHKDWTFTLLTKERPRLTHQRLKVIEILPYNQFRELMGKSSLCIIPSVWAEPLSRTALDALSLATPVVASDRGGTPEIIIDGKYGYISKLNARDFLEAIENGIKNRDVLRQNIINDHGSIRKKFYDQPIRSYLSLFQKL